MVMEMSDTSFLMMVFVLPNLFGLSLVGEGISKIVNYDPSGWVGVVAGSGFLIVVVVAFFMIKNAGL